MPSYPKLCQTQQIELSRILHDPPDHAAALRLFLNQHALLHSAAMSGSMPWSFEDMVLDNMTEDQVRRIPSGGEHSVAWLVWHMTRCEDITMNLLIAGSPQVLSRDNWLSRLEIPFCDTGNAMSRSEIDALSIQVNLLALRSYRLSVGRRTRQIAQELQPQDLPRKVSPTAMQRVWDEGAVVEAARGIADYWSRRDVAGLLLMPATRHNLTHWNEALALKRKLQP
jgi:hypothetical protein